MSSRSNTLLRALLVTACLAVPVVASSHDFWMQPERYQVKDGDTVPFAFLIGDTGKSEHWNLLWERVVSLQVIGPDGRSRDLQTGIRLTTADDKGGASAVIRGVGTHLIAFQSHHSFSDLEAERFNPYIVSEGLTPAIDFRATTKSTKSNGTELYSRRSKTLIQVGPTLSAQVTEPVGHTLEIVPEAHPYAVRKDHALPLRIYFRGKPLAGARVTVHRVDADIEKLQTVVSDAEGRAGFTVAPVGAWKANVVWTQPIIGHERAQFETIFTSLSFGY